LWLRNKRTWTPKIEPVKYLIVLYGIFGIKS